MRPKLVIIGAAGRMGKRIISLSVDVEWFDIIAAVERKGHPDIGKDALMQKVPLVCTQCAATILPVCTR